jgi:hypothetical protein
LVGVVHARVHERLLDTTAIDRNRGLVGVLLDDREQVAEQPPLGRGQLDPLDGLVSVRMLEAVDRRARGGNQRRLRPAALAAPLIGPTLAAPLIGPTLAAPLIGPTLAAPLIGPTLAAPLIGPTLAAPLIGPTLPADLLALTRVARTGFGAPLIRAALIGPAALLSRPRGRPVLCRAVLLLDTRATQPLGWGFALVRNRLPSSYRCA